MTTHSQLGRHSTLRCTPSLPALSLHRAALYSRTTSHGDAQRASRLVPVAAAAPGGRGGAGGGDAADDNRLLQAAQRDPVSFLGGVFAGFLALSLDQGEPTCMPLRLRCMSRHDRVLLG